MSDADWWGWIRLNPGTDVSRLLTELDRRDAEMAALKRDYADVSECLRNERDIARRARVVGGAGMTNITLPREPTPEILAAMQAKICCVYGCKYARPDQNYITQPPCNAVLYKTEARAVYAALVEHLSGREKEWQ